MYTGAELKVIIFEDNEPVLKAIVRLVGKYGHEALGFSDPTFCPLYADSECSCPREKPCADVLITDNAMPRMTGLEFVRLQALKGCRGIMRHKAVMSGSWTREQLVDAENMGCKVFSKPIDVPELIDWLAECQEEINRSR